MDSQRNGTSILMLPWLAYGHISPFFELAKKLSHKNFRIYLCSSPINLKPFRENFSNYNLSSIHLIDLHLPSSPELPPNYHTTKYLPLHLNSTLKTAFDTAKPAFCNILKTLKPDLLIYDFEQPWAPAAALEHNIRSVVFLTFGAAYGHSRYDSEYDLQLKERFMECIQRSSNIVLIKTSKEIEAKYFDRLSLLTRKELIPTGPLIHDPTNKDANHKALMKWLSRKDPSSVVFVSFGSEYFLSKEEMEEMAHGLELSQLSFIWVVRFHGGDETIIQEALPEGFINRVGERGVVVEGWAPQAKILGHPNIGGFVSHCGWSSTVEGMIFGVPIIAMPMLYDQPTNARLVVEIGVGMKVERDNGRLKREEVARVIKQVVVQEEGEGVRRKAKEVGERSNEKKGG